MNFPPKSRVFKKAKFFTLCVELHALLKKERCPLDVSKVRRKLDDFFQQVELASLGEGGNESPNVRYYKAALQVNNQATFLRCPSALFGLAIRC